MRTVLRLRDPCEPHDNKYCYGGWVGAEWLHWQLDGNRLPPLVTSGPATTPLADVAQLDDPDTQILSGDETVNDGWRNGFRLSGGVWLNCCHTWGIGGDYFNIGNDDYNFLGQPDPNLIIGRPFFNTETGADDAELVSVPDELDGTVHVNSSDDFQGAGLTLTHCLWRCCDCCTGNESQIAGLGGYRYYKYDSDLTITENLTVLPNTTTPLVPGTTFFVQDSFRTRNEFNGGELGLQGYKQHCWWWVDGMAKIALGQNSRTVTVSGRTITDVPGGGTSDDPGGLLTSGETNIGTYHDSDFVVIPEFRLGVGALLTRCWAVHAGYNVIIWSDVSPRRVSSCRPVSKSTRAISRPCNRAAVRSPNSPASAARSSWPRLRFKRDAGSSRDARFTPFFFAQDAIHRCVASSGGIAASITFVISSALIPRSIISRFMSASTRRW